MTVSLHSAALAYLFVILSIPGAVSTAPDAFVIMRYTSNTCTQWASNSSVKTIGTCQDGEFKVQLFSPPICRSALFPPDSALIPQRTSS